jgi:hypothetical protein
MRRRSKDIAVGEYMRAVLEPMARRVGVDQNATFFAPPASERETAFYAYRVGLSLLMAYTYPDGWTQSDLAPRARQAKRSARRARAALLSPRGPDAIALMSQGYAWEIAQSWWRSAEAAESVDEERQLRQSAGRAEHLSELVAKLWPVEAEHVRDRVAAAELERYFDPDSPDAMVDLRAYAGRARVNCIAVSLLVGEEAEEEVAAMRSRVMTFDILFDEGVLADWNFEGEHLANLLGDERLAYGEVVLLQNAAAMAEPE